MKKLIVSAFLLVTMVVFVWPFVSEHASPKACFGQGRANYALNGSESVGYWASLRQGDNSWMNQDYMDACQPQ